MVKESTPSTKMLRDTRSVRPQSAVRGNHVERSAGTPAKLLVLEVDAQRGVLVRETVAVVEPPPGDLSQ